jgi:arylsulfatase A-like enzyme
LGGRGDTPFTWMKQIASNYGGTGNGLVVHWLKGIGAKNEVRSQWHHVIEVAPSVLDAAGWQTGRKKIRRLAPHRIACLMPYALVAQ